MNTPSELGRYLQFLEVDPHNLQLLAYTADIAFQEAQWAQASNLAQRGLSLAPDHLGLLGIGSSALMSLGKISEARALLQTWVASNQAVSPQAGEQAAVLHYNLAYCLVLEGEYAPAAQYLEDAEHWYEVLPLMVHLKVNVLHYLADITGAITLAERIIVKNPADAVLHGQLSTLYIDHVNFNQAKWHAAEAVKLGHANTDALSSLGTLALSEQEDVNAMQYFTQAIALKPNNGRAWLGKAMAEMLQRKLPEAEMSFKEAIRFMPKHLGTWQALAWCQIGQQKLDEADATIETSLAIDQNFAESHGALAVLHILRGHPELAQIPTMRALWLDKQSFTGLYAQALLLQLQGKTSDSEALVQGLLDHPLLPDQTSLRQLLVRYLSKS